MTTTFGTNALSTAREYLREFPVGVQRKGEAYFRSGAVGSIACSTPGEELVAIVTGSREYEVTLSYVPPLSGADPGGWLGDCTCPMQEDCKHCYAAMQAWLARGAPLQSSPARSDAGSLRVIEAGGRKAPPEIQRVPLDALLRKALNRSLKSDELRYVARVEQVFRESVARGQFMNWDARTLGFHVQTQSWDRLNIWHALPTHAVEFWQHVAYAAVHLWGASIPHFMKPITDFETNDESLRRWRRAQMLDHWKELVETARDETLQQSTVAEVDLRLRLTPDRPLLEIQPDVAGAFKELKSTPARQLYNRIESGEVTLSNSAELFWSILGDWLMEGSTWLLKYDDDRSRAFLDRMIRTPSLQPAIVTQSGTPYFLAPERLKWSMGEPNGPEEDYSLHLVQADGSPVPPLLFALPGRSVICATADTLFFGPPCPATLRPRETGLRIPAPALESSSGIDLLRGMSVELPARLQQAVRIVPVHLRIRCELKESYPGSSTEQCRFQMFARSADGLVNESWNGAGWVTNSPAQRERPRRTKNGKAAAAPAGIVSYDRSTQAGAPALFGGIDLKWETWQGFGQKRVTKKFPEEFISWQKSLPPHVELELVGDLASLTRDVVSGSVKLEATEAGIDWFDLQVILDVSDTDLSPAEIKLLLDAKGGYVRLGGKGWRRLQFNLSEDEDERLARLGLNPREMTSEPQRLHALQLADDAAKRFLPEEQFERVQRRATELQARVTPDVPASVQAELRPYQKDGFHFLAYLSTNRFGGILADDMGLGKTLQTLAWLQWVRDGRTGGSPPSLVVCPKSVMDNWRSETTRFAPNLRVRMWPAAELDQMPGALDSADLHVLNYSQLRLLGESITTASWLAVILDEGQYIKNPDSQTAQVARSLRAEHRLILTGTPIENRLMDLWSLMTFAMPGVLGSRAQFNRLFDSKEDPFARRRLAARVRPFLIRRTKSQVARDLPDRTEEDLLCQMEGEQLTLYRAELKRAQQMLLKVQTQKQLAKDRFHFLTSLLRLRQICCDPRLVKANSRGESAKVEALLDQLDPLMEEGQKVLVFSQFVTMLDLLRETLKPKGWPVHYLAGDTENRGELVADFQKTTGPGIFLISLKAGGFGLNLTAASYVVLFDPWWNPAVENQAIDRTHRIGQTQKVIAYRLLIKDSIEEKIRSLQKQKSALAEDVLGEEKFAQSLTLDDLRFLFSD